MDSSRKSGLPLYRAMRKYGIENFHIEEIDGANSQSELNYLETHYIYKNNSLTPNGYNSTVLTSSGLKHSEETKQKISNKIKYLDENNLRKIKKGKNSHMYGNSNRKGVKLSKDTRSKISEAQKGRELKQSTKDKMSKTHSERMKNQELRDQISKKLKKNSTLKKPIVRDDGVVFESLNECARQMGIKPSNLCVALKKGGKCSGYRFKYLENK